MEGKIKSMTQNALGSNENGEPIVVESFFGDEIPCKYYANRFNNKGTYVDGIFTQQEYSITIKDMSFDATQIQLINSRGNVVCEKRVQSLEVLESVKRVKITI